MPVKSNHLAFALVVKELTEGPITTKDVVEVSGLYIQTARYLMNALHKYQAVHICAWEPNSRGVDTTPVYKLGRGKDKPKAKKSGAEKTQDYRTRRDALNLVNSIVGKPKIQEAA